MTLSAESLEILTYLKTAHGKFVSLAEISRRAGGRRRFEESPNWAKNLMSILLDAELIQVNSRGHYRLPSKVEPQAPSKPVSAPLYKSRAKIIGDDYFPAPEKPHIVGGDYFPNSD